MTPEEHFSELVRQAREVAGKMTEPRSPQEATNQALLGAMLAQLGTQLADLSADLATEFLED